MMPFGGRHQRGVVSLVSGVRVAGNSPDTQKYGRLHPLGGKKNVLKLSSL